LAQLHATNRSQTPEERPLRREAWRFLGDFGLFFIGLRENLQENPIFHGKTYGFLFPDAPWCWNIYLYLGDVWGKCRQIFHTWSIWGCFSVVFTHYKW
jgi:hypothetical protein